MKGINILHIGILCLVFALVASSCNVTKDGEATDEPTEEMQKRPSPFDQNTIKKPANTSRVPQNNNSQVSYDEFKKMSVEEQWKSLAPSRRNYLRQNPDLYPRYKEMIAAEPEIEEEND